jgi:hypothetical protein
MDLGISEFLARSKVKIIYVKKLRLLIIQHGWSIYIHYVPLHLMVSL